MHADYAMELVYMHISFHVCMCVAIWGAGLSFSKCHAERKVKVDPHTPNIFDGEEFSKAMRYWTYGYDIYSPHRVYVLHDYNISQVFEIESTYRFFILTIIVELFLLRLVGRPAALRLGGEQEIQGFEGVGLSLENPVRDAGGESQPAVHSGASAG